MMYCEAGKLAGALIEHGARNELGRRSADTYKPSGAHFVQMRRSPRPAPRRASLTVCKVNGGFGCGQIVKRGLLRGPELSTSGCPSVLRGVGRSPAWTSACPLLGVH
ncbi:hypothetical protein NDU88_001040 [Pleurodeles waltl]|uniref:Uncharacterized protein n=1 Tax=Pleurodeles waltl TaxID=8319 RepID=A0AAV7P6S7_PLEWA|nr:hypothetical protein NDU88_001040 [Pleurodeles waltl]